GYSTRVAIFPDDDLAIAVLADTSTARAGKLSLDASRAALGSKAGPPAEQPLEPSARTAYVGDYSFPEQQLELHIYDRDGALFVRATDPVGDRIVFLGAATFTTPDEPDVLLRFGPGGRLILDYYGSRLFGERVR